MMLLRLEGWLRVSLVIMRSGDAGLVSAKQLVRTTRNVWIGVLVKRIACYARMVLNFGEVFVLRQGGPLRLLK